MKKLLASILIIIMISNIGLSTNASVEGVITTDSIYEESLSYSGTQYLAFDEENKAKEFDYTIYDGEEEEEYASSVKSRVYDSEQSTSDINDTGADLLSYSGTEWLEVDGIEGGKIQFDYDTGTITDANINITSANIPQYINGVAVTNIGEAAFYECTVLTSVSMTDEVVYIGEGAFCKCYSLKNITLSNSLTIIERLTFAGCWSLEGIYIPANVIEIEEGAFDSCSALKAINIPDGVQEIHAAVFQYCESLIEIDISDSVTVIEEYTFYSCYSLETVVLPDNVNSIGEKAFAYCYSLNSIEIPESVVKIGTYAFFHCEALPMVTLYEKVESIAAYAFGSCYSLTDIYVSEDNEVYSSENGVLYNKEKSTLIVCPAGKSSSNIEVPEGVTVLSNYCFRECALVEGIELPNSVLEIGMGAFYYCYSLESIIIPEKIKIIEDGLFAYCIHLVEVDIPETVMEISGGAFFECVSLETIDIPYAVSEIGAQAFMDCDSLETIIISKNVDSIGVEAFALCDNLMSINVSSNNNKYGSLDGILCSSDLTELIQCPAGKTGYVEISEGVTKVGEACFQNCFKINGIILPDSLGEIEDGAFYFCSGLGSVEIPSGVYSIGMRAFYGCSSLKSMFMPVSVTVIGSDVFGNANSLSNIYYKGTLADWCSINGYSNIDESITIHYEYDFIREIYQANYLIESEPMFITHDTIASSAVKETGTAYIVLSEAWKLVENFFEGLEDPSVILDIANSEKDVYSAIIMQIVSQELDYDSIYEDCQAWCEVIDLLGSVIDFGEALGNEEFEPENWEAVEEIVDEVWGDNYSLEGTIGVDILGVVKDIALISKSVDEFNNKLILLLTMYSMEEQYVLALECMIENCPTTHSNLKEVLEECVDVSEKTSEEIESEIINSALEVSGSAVVDMACSIWDQAIEDGFTKTNPAVASIIFAYKIGSFVSNGLTGAGDIVDSYDILICAVNIETLAKLSYESMQATYLSNKNIENASTLIALADFIHGAQDISYVKAIDFVNANDTLYTSIVDFFTNENKIETSLEALDEERNVFGSSYLSSKAMWVTQLQYDYPDSGLTEQYLYLLEDYIEDVKNKEYIIACPVDIYVYDEAGNLVASIIDDSIEEINDESITICVEGDKKTIWLDSNIDYEVVCIGNDDGEMDIQINDFDENNEIESSVIYYDIPLAVDTQYTSNTLKNDLVDSDNITINSDIVKDSLSIDYNIEIEDGYMEINGEYVLSGTAAEGERISITALIPEGYEFVSWSSDAGTDVFLDMYSENTEVAVGEQDVKITAILKSVIGLLGDVNGDDTVNVTDIMLMYKHINEVEELISDEQQYADTNGDGAINVTDIMLMYKHINEVESLF